METNAKDVIERAKVLLRAAHELLRKCDQARYVLNVLEQTASYDGTQCDGYFLGADIERWFAMDLGEEMPDEHFS